MGEGSQALLVFVLWGIIMFSIFRKINAEKNKQQKKPPHPPQTPSAPPKTSPKPAAAKQAPQQAPKPAPKPATPPPEPRIQQTVKVTPHDHSDMFAGSMQAESTEGVDLCHPGEHQEMPSDISEHFFDEPLDSSHAELPAYPNQLVQALVLQEVLKRPSERRRRT